MALKKSQLYSSLWSSCDELRGGMDASQYKDYVLVLLFVKYVSDKYAGKKDALLDVPKGGRFSDMVALKGDKEIGDKMNKIIGKLAEANDLKGVIDVADFNDADKLGKGKEMVDRLSNLVAIFDSPSLDFSGNRAEGDDLLGDAYEYLMRHFATESGKSKGQFYTPAEVSRVMAKVVGVGSAKSASQTIHDPTCGSGSLLLKAHDEAKGGTGLDLALYGQEMDNATSALARMNMILHDCPTAEIWKDNVLASPHFKSQNGALKTFDFVVANPPFSFKAWSNGFKPAEDEFKRFAFGVPPAKNGDLAFLLHILACLKSNGKAAVNLPHGVLFRGNSEGAIRREIGRRGYVKGIIGLPANLFYGTSIPACIVVLDKENAHARKGIFMIDASKGFIKDGNKNRLRAQDIHRIVDTFTRQLEVPGYSRMVPLTEISDPRNDFNLNLPRYIDSTEPEDLQDIRQNLDNQKKVFIEHFFSTMQWIMAGNDTEGLRYGTVQTPEKYYLTWKEESNVENLLDRGLIQMCGKARFLELIHDFVLFDAGTKKLSRHNQYFAVRASQDHLRRREGGIIWNTQGSGKSLIMVWLAKWIREHVKDARVLLITDRTELDEQIEKVFLGVNEAIYRTKSGADLIATLNVTKPWLICSLVHKFGGKEDGEEVGDIPGYVEEVKKALPPGFAAKGNLFVFVDECHRTQSGDLHDAMKAVLPGAMFIGFTGTPLLKADKKRSIEVFGGYIHTYRFNQAVKDKVVLDLRYEARDIDQRITSQAKIDQWFEAKTKGLTDLAKAQLKQRWGTMRKVLSSQSRLHQIVADIQMDMATRDRLSSGHGNAMLVAGSIYEACKIYDLFDKTDLHGKCAIVTSYQPSTADLKGEESGEGETDNIEKYNTYLQMLADWFNEAPEKAVNRIEEFEKAVKKKFIDEPGQMKLLIVVDKLLTGFDAPPATCLYIDKKMKDHGLFQAICRVNRLDGDDKEYGYIIDYKDLFKSLEGAVQDYTSGALDGYDKEDVAGLLENRLGKARERLEDALETMRALCEAVEAPKDQQAYFRYFSSKDHGNVEQLKANEPQRLSLYKLAAALVRAYADLASEMAEAGYSQGDAEAIKKEVSSYENLRTEVKLHSGDAIDLKQYEPAMRHLIDTYIHAEESEKVSAFDDLSLVQLIVERGAGALKALPAGIRKDKEAAAETIENNVRKLIIDESPINPKYYERMSELLDALIKQRRQEAIAYEEYLRQVVELAKAVKNPADGANYPANLNTPARRALYDNLGKDAVLALAVDAAVRDHRQDDWRNNPFKVKKVKNAINVALNGDVERADVMLELVKNQDEY